MALQLYYDNYKGLVKSENGAIGQSIIEHDQKGWKAPLHEQIMEIPSRNVKIVVRTNFGWGPKSYMNASISLMDKCVFNFIDVSMRHSITMVYSEPGDWNALFDGIISLYNNIYNSENSINTYFDIIEETINTDDAIYILSRICARLAEIANNLPDSIYSDNVIVDKRMKSACRLLLQHIMEKENWNSLSDETHQTIETKLQSIFKYLAGRKELLDVLANISPSAQ